MRHKKRIRHKRFGTSSFLCFCAFCRAIFFFFYLPIRMKTAANTRFQFAARVDFIWPISSA